MKRRATQQNPKSTSRGLLWRAIGAGGGGEVMRDFLGFATLYKCPYSTSLPRLYQMRILTTHCWSSSCLIIIISNKVLSVLAIWKKFPPHQLEREVKKQYRWEDKTSISSYKTWEILPVSQLRIHHYYAWTKQQGSIPWTSGHSRNNTPPPNTRKISSYKTWQNLFSQSLIQLQQNNRQAFLCTSGHWCCLVCCWSALLFIHFSTFISNRFSANHCQIALLCDSPIMVEENFSQQETKQALLLPW